MTTSAQNNNPLSLTFPSGFSDSSFKPRPISDFDPSIKTIFEKGLALTTKK